MKTPTKCEIVPIKPIKSWRPKKRRSSKSYPPKLSPPMFDQFPPSPPVSCSSSPSSSSFSSSSGCVSRRYPWLKIIFPWLNGSVGSLPPLRAGATLSVGLQLSSSVVACVFVFLEKTKLRLNHPQACCTWLISSPKRSNSPSTQGPFSRHFCTVSSCPSSPVCTRSDAIWRWEGQCDAMCSCRATQINEQKQTV